MCVLTAGTVVAQTPVTNRVPTKQDVVDALNRATDEARRLDRSDVGRQLSNVESLARQGGINLDELIAQHNQIARNQVLPQRDVLLVFVSLSMPKDALIRVGKDTNRAGGKILFRGFHNNKLSEMYKAIKFLNEAGITDIAVDPESFKRYNIKHVPTYVIARVEESAEQLPACRGDAVCRERSYVAIAGDVTLDYALDKMLDRAPPTFVSSLKEYLRRLGR